MPVPVPSAVPAAAVPVAAVRVAGLEVLAVLLLTVVPAADVGELLLPPVPVPCPTPAHILSTAPPK